MPTVMRSNTGDIGSKFLNWFESGEFYFRYDRNVKNSTI